MGVFRLILSLLVVGSHVGGLGSAPSGGTAVACFYVISGFLMARTISENYRGLGFGRFYLNRLIRLGPPLLMVLALTALLLWARDSRGFQLRPHEARLFMPTEFPSSIAYLVEWNPSGFPIFLYPQFHLIPQAWSLLAEGSFYVVAPLLVVLFERRGRALVWLLAAASLALTLVAARHNGDWIRSPIAAFWIFALGMESYYQARAGRWQQLFDGRAQRWAGALLVPVTVLAMQSVLPFQQPIYIGAPLFVAAWLIIGRWHARRSSGVDLALGNIAYGVFLAHFLGVMTMMWIAEAIYHRTGVFGVFSTPDHTPWLVATYSSALIAGTIVYLLVERPLEQLRKRVRRGRRPAGGPSPAIAQPA